MWLPCGLAGGVAGFVGWWVWMYRFVVGLSPIFDVFVLRCFAYGLLLPSATAFLYTVLAHNRAEAAELVAAAWALLRDHGVLVPGGRILSRELAAFPAALAGAAGALAGKAVTLPAAVAADTRALLEGGPGRLVRRIVTDVVAFPGLVLAATRPLLVPLGEVAESLLLGVPPPKELRVPTLEEFAELLQDDDADATDRALGLDPPQGGATSDSEPKRVRQPRSRAV